MRYKIKWIKWGWFNTNEEYGYNYAETGKPFQIFDGAGHCYLKGKTVMEIQCFSMKSDMGAGRIEFDDQSYLVINNIHEVYYEPINE